MSSLLFPKNYSGEELTYYINRAELVEDLRLEKISKWMAKGDIFIERTMLQLMMIPLKSMDLILWRQEVIKDCIEHREDFDQMYQICNTCLKRTNQYLHDNHSKNVSITPTLIASEIQYYRMMLDDILEIWGIIQSMASTSRGVKEFREQLSKDYGMFPILELEQLRSEMEALNGDTANELWIHANLGVGFKLEHAYVEDIVLEEKRKFGDSVKKTAKHLLSKFIHIDYIDLKDESIKRELLELETCGLKQIHQVYIGMIKRTLPFFDQLKKEVAFYIGADNYYHAFRMKALPVCFPIPRMKDTKQMEFEELYEPVIGFETSGNVVTNDSELHDVSVTIISGANQGGKSTYLKGIGIAQIFMQCGLMVNAKKFSSNCYDEIFTHFTRMEDKYMKHSRFEDELVRLDGMLDHFTKNTMLLMNESFGSTTEQEGSEIAMDLTNVLYDAGIVVFFVTHLYEYAIQLYERQLADVTFLNAGRLQTGARTYKMIPQKPNATSYGIDLFDQFIDI